MKVPVSPEINEILDDATEISIRRGQYYVGVEHLFEAILVKADLLPAGFAKAYSEALRGASHEMTREMWRGTVPVLRPEVFYTPRCAALTKTAARLAERLGNASPTAGHLLLAMLADAHAAPSRAMDRIGFPRGEMIEALRGELLRLAAAAKRPAVASQRANRANAETASAAARPPAPAESPDDDGRSESRTLDTLVRDLTAAAQAGRLEAAIGRDREMATILEILARKTKNNVILVGEAGVGKTRIVEGLALATASGATGGMLNDYRFLELNIGALLAGTQYRGAFEARLLGLLEELKRAPKTVLFIDEIHLIMGAGGVEGGSADMANLLKPALSRGEIRCIGATTVGEYRKFIEKDPAIERRFQMLRIEQLSPEATWQVLNHLRPSLERHHGVRVGTRAMRAAITLSQRYMPNRQLPDKAIDVLDQACARYRLKAVASKAKPGLFASDSSTPLGEKVTPHDVRRVISRMTGVPIEEITAEERIRLGDLEGQLNRRIVGQEEAVRKTVSAVKKARAGLADPNRPEAVLLFLGPTGVGKTQLAKALAARLYGSANHLIPFDMGEYVEAHSVSRLLGAAPGLIRSDEEGRLAQAVRTAPFSILLFDEIEKAHPSIFDIFLPILDEGRMQDAQGRELSFKNCIIIFTSNIGADLLRHPADPPDNAKLMEALRGHFRPEFINRIDEIVPFYPLLFEDIRTILRLNLQEVNERLKEKGIRLRVFQGAYEFLAKRGYNREFGARELRRTVERYVMNPISERVVAGAFQSGDVIEVLDEDGELIFRKGETLIEPGVLRA